jgi:hypothetical protein
MMKMNKKKFGIGLTILNESGVKGVITFTDSMVALWLTYFQDVDGDVFIQACMRHIAQSRFFPTISEILDICLEKIDHLSIDQIWAEFKNTKKDERDPLITEAFRLAGISKGYLQTMTTDTGLRYARPAVEKVYKRLLGEEKKYKIDYICNKALISHNANKAIGDKNE